MDILNNQATTKIGTINRTINAVKTNLPPKIDGKLDDSAWQDAAVVTGFTQFEINEGQPASEETIVKITYDDHNIYFGIRCFDSNPSKIRANFSNRDELSNDDRILLHLDTFNSKRRAIVLGVNPYGIQFDGLIDENNWVDSAWDMVFKSEGTIDEKGWTAEISIPLKSLRFPREETQDWGILIIRYIGWKNEKNSWPPLQRKINGYIQQAGEIKGLKVKSPRIIELTPYLAGGYQEEVDPTNQRWNGDKYFSGGIDLKYGLSSNLILDFTLNPDFSQVEADADQIEINRRYENYYPEKRPFFLESMEKFQTPIEVFYSRRILDPFLGAKITGTLGPYNIGFASIWDGGPNNNSNTLFNILRLQKDLENQSNVGFIFTDKEYKEEGIYRYNRVFGIDSRIHFLEYYTLTLQGLGSWAFKELNGQNEEVATPAVQAGFERDDGTLYTLLRYLDIAPDFQVDAGFIKRKDIRQLTAYIQYRFRPESWLRHWEPYTIQEIIFNHENNLTDRWHQFGLGFEFKGNTSLQTFYDLQEEKWLNTKYQKNNFGLILSSDPSKFFAGSLFFLMGESIYYDKETPFLGWRYALSLESDINPHPKLALELSSIWENFRKSINGNEVYNIWLLRGKINYQISPSLFIRIVAQGSTYEENFSLNALFGFVPLPGTVFYLGYNEKFQLGENLGSTERIFFTKLSYHWQL